MYATTIVKLEQKYELYYPSLMFAMLAPDTDPLALLSALKNNERSYKTEFWAALTLWVALNHKDKLQEYVDLLDDPGLLRRALRYGGKLFKELGVNAAVNTCVADCKKVKDGVKLLVLSADSQTKLYVGNQQIKSRYKNLESFKTAWSKLAAEVYDVAVYSQQTSSPILTVNFDEYVAGSATKYYSHIRLEYDKRSHTLKTKCTLEEGYNYNCALTVRLDPSTTPKSKSFILEPIKVKKAILIEEYWYGDRKTKGFEKMERDDMLRVLKSIGVSNSKTESKPGAVPSGNAN